MRASPIFFSCYFFREHSVRVQPVPSAMWFLDGVGLIASFFPGHLDLSTKTLLRHP